MNKIVLFLKKNYIYVNITILLLTIYVILFPYVAIILEKIDPRLVQCPYLRATGRPCPLCGGTRYIAGLSTVFKDITYLFNPFGIIVIVIFLETIFRIYNIVSIKKEKNYKYVKIDLYISIFLFLCFTLYEIVFIILQNSFYF